MTRAISLLVFLLLVAALFLVPSASPSRLAAFEAAQVLDEPESTDADVPWRERVAVGDRVRREEHGEALEVARVGDGAVTLRLATPDAEGLPQFEEVRLEDVPDVFVRADDGAPRSDNLVKRPLWRALVESGAFEGDHEDESGREAYVFHLGGTHFRSRYPDAAWHPDTIYWHGVARSSILRKMRTIAADEDDGFGLRVVGAKAHSLEDTARGANFGVNASPDLFDEDGGLVQERELRVQFHVADEEVHAARIRYTPPGQLSLLPPLVAIFLAILLRRPVLALFCGVLSGAILKLYLDGAGLVESVTTGAVDVFDTYLMRELTERARTEIILFVVFMLAMVGVITRSGGILGLMNSIAKLAKDVRRTQVATWLMGLAVFFDDYANTILVGSTMRPLTDRFKIAREKLAYIVDSTAAPVAGISIFSTWIAFEVSTFSAQLPDAGLTVTDGYQVFLQTMPYRFYCFLTLFFVGLVVFTGRDFGPMLTAERRARGGLLLRVGARPLVSKAATELAASPKVTPRAAVAVVPLLAFIFGTLGMILWSGKAFGMSPSRFFSIQGATTVLYDGSGTQPLMYGALLGLFLAVGFALAAGLRLEIAGAAWNSLRAMSVAFLILYLAWMVGGVCSDLGTAAYLSVTLGDTLPYMLLPLVLFALASLVAFSTGSSWSTMTILLPLVVGLAYNLGYGAAPVESLGEGYGRLLMIISIGAVLEGAIFGDHCSPISDTTVMSSIASASDHIDHVRTQAPYALLTMLVAIVFGYFPAAFFGEPGRGWLPYACLAAGAATLTTFLFVYGRHSPAVAAASSEAEAA
jgi:Na+/H+ antiporter NhaC